MDDKKYKEQLSDILRGIALDVADNAEKIISSTPDLICDLNVTIHVSGTLDEVPSYSVESSHYSKRVYKILTGEDFENGK